MYQAVELSFSDLMELNVKAKQGKIDTSLNDPINTEELLQALKKKYKVFKMVKSITLTHNDSKGFYITGKTTNFFNVKRIGNVITLSLENGTKYHVERKS